MNGSLKRWAAVLVAVVVVLALGAASAQGLWYKEVEKDGRVYVFNTSAAYQNWLKTGSVHNPIALANHGPHGETVIAENETAIDLYNLKHDLPGYDRPATKPAPPPSNPTRIRIAQNGEIWFGGLFQGWFIGDTSLPGPGVDWLGNNTGQNTFRIRRAEMKMQGKFGSDWGFLVMIDPAKQINTIAGTDGKILQDLFVSYFGLKGQEFSIGQNKIDLTEEGVRSSSELWFGERAQITRAFSDTRQMGFFYKGNLGDHLTLWSAITNGTIINNNSDTNDTIFYSGRLDVKLPIKGLTLGPTGGTGKTGGSLAHLSRSLVSGYIKYGGYDVPGSKLWLEFEYLWAQEERADGSNLVRDGYYASALYLFGDHFQIGVRYDVLNNDRNNPHNERTMWTTGFHWLPLWKNLNIKLEWYNINIEGRTVNDVGQSVYNEFLLAAQAAF
jgi:hypothetical protein